MQARVAEALQDTPVVCLLGPRQCGKSTLAVRMEPSRLLVSLDDAAYFKLAQQDPQGFLAEFPDEVTIDEVQRAPGLQRLAAYAKNSFQSGIVFHDGEDILTSGDSRFLAVPISKLWEL